MLYRYVRFVPYALCSYETLLEAAMLNVHGIPIHRVGLH